MSSSTTTDCPPQARARIFATAEFSRVGRLPEEILMKIIEYVHHNSKSELTGYGHGPLEHLVKLHEFDQDPCPYVYLPPQPILNSLQALAAVNQTCYRLCRRLLWHKLCLPNLRPTPMSRWTEGILPQCGHLIQIADVTLSDDIFETGLLPALPNGLTPEPYTDETNQHGTTRQAPGVQEDNLMILDPHLKDHPFEPPRAISPKGVRDVVCKLTNLRSLTMHLPDRIPDHVHVDLNTPHRIMNLALIGQILLCVPWLETLDLDFEPDNNYTYEAICLTLFLPRSLKTLRWSSDGVRGGTIATSTAFFNSLTLRLKDLESLVLIDLPFVDSSGLLKALPSASLRKLTFDCPYVDVSLAPLAISHFAANLTHLSFGLTSNLLGIQITGNNVFDLPSLVYLQIKDSKLQEILMSFINCTQLRHLVYDPLPQTQWPSLTHLIYSSTWPELEKLCLSCPSAEVLADVEEGEDLFVDQSVAPNASQNRFRAFCEKKEIRLALNKWEWNDADGPMIEDW